MRAQCPETTAPGAGVGSDNAESEVAPAPDTSPELLHRSTRKRKVIPVLTGHQKLRQQQSRPELLTGRYAWKQSTAWRLCWSCTQSSWRESSTEKHRSTARCISKRQFLQLPAFQHILGRLRDMSMSQSACTIFDQIWLVLHVLLVLAGFYGLQGFLLSGLLPHPLHVQFLQQVANLVYNSLYVFQYNQLFPTLSNTDSESFSGPKVDRASKRCWMFLVHICTHLPVHDNRYHRCEGCWYTHGANSS